jgi:hypothetical protein
MSADLLERPAPAASLPASLRALTLWQPWAALVADGRKRIETRSWSTAHRGRIAIHAARKVPRLDEAPKAWGAFGLEVYEATRSTEAPGRFPPSGQIADALPLGAVVATCTLTDVVPMVGLGDYPPREGGWLSVGAEVLLLREGPGPPDRSDERPYGDFASGRYAWLLEDVELLPEPIPARGRQGLWWWRP